MNTIQENSQHELRELEQKRNTLGKYYAYAQGAFSAGVLCILAFFMVFKTDDENSIAYSFIAGAFVLLFIAFAVSLFKYRMSHLTVVSKKKELGIPVKEDSSKRFFSTANPTWEEKTGKLLGVVITVLGLLVFIPGWINKYSSLSIDIPALFKEYYLLIAGGLVMIGMNITNYRPDLSLLSRISLWATGILLLASLPMCYMGYRMGNWMMGAAWVLGMFNMIRVEREALLLKQEDMDD